MSALDSSTRARLLAEYANGVYAEAFPDPELREDPEVWRRLLDADPYPPPPQPLIEVVLLLDESGAVAGGATVEFYREPRCGLLTYISIARNRRGRGLGRLLISEARLALAAVSGLDPLLFAETERLQDAQDDHEVAETRLRQRQLSGLGARLVDTDYVMPPLRAGLPPRSLHLIVFDERPGRVETIESSIVLKLVQELAEALGADLAADPRTQTMVDHLRAVTTISVSPLPDAGPTRG